MCQLCEQLGLDLHKFTTIEASDSGRLGAETASWAALPLDGGSGSTGQNPLSDTVSGSTSTSFSMSSGTSVRGYVNSAGDQDWYNVTLVAGQTYTFALSGFGKGALSDAYLQLFNASGTEIAADDDSGPLYNSLLTFTASTSGTYYVSAGGFGSITGQYLLTMNAGSTPYAPVVSIGDVADYLTNSYWEVNGTVAHHWGTASVTFNVQGLEPERAALARTAFQVWSEVANLTFVETTGAAQIMLDDTQPGAYSSSSYDGNGIMTSAIVNVATNWYGGIDAVDSYTLQTFIHEIGHALGLGHGGPYNGSATYGVDNTYANDTWQLSLMSYMDQTDYGSASFRFTMTPMMADILAAQNLYGAAATRTGDTVYGFGSTAGSLYNFSTYANAPALTIYDSGGTDTLNASGYSQNQVINLTGGSFSNIGGLVGNIGIYTTSVIEKAVGGSGNDTIIANNFGCTLTGSGGNDTLIGGTGFDTAIFSGPISQYQFAVQSNGSLQVTDMRGGAPDGADNLTSIECLQFFDTTYILQAPVVTISNANVLATTNGQVFQASTLFNATDANNDALTYWFIDNSPGGGSGHFEVAGVARPEGGGNPFSVTQAQLAQTTFIAGANGATDNLYVGAVDATGLFSGWQPFHITAPANAVPHAPQVTIPNANVQATTNGQVLQASTLFNATDADNDALTYWFIDNSPGGGSGHFEVAGVARPEGGGNPFSVTQAQLAQATFIAGANGAIDNLYVGAVDATGLFSGWQPFHVTAPAPVVPQAPVVTIPNANVQATTNGQVIQASTLFNATDANNDALTYWFIDNSPGGGSGHFEVAGVARPEGGSHPFSATQAQLAQTTFVAGANGTTDNLYVGAVDATGLFSGWQPFHVTAPVTVNHAPVVTIPNANVQATTPGQVIQASTLFNATDADNDALTYWFIDNTVGGGSGHFEVAGVARPEGSNHFFSVTQAQLAQTTFVAGANGITDDLYAGAVDATGLFSGWQNFHVFV